MVKTIKQSGHTFLRFVNNLQAAASAADLSESIFRRLDIRMQWIACISNRYPSNLHAFHQYEGPKHRFSIDFMDFMWISSILGGFAWFQVVLKVLGELMDSQGSRSSGLWQP